MKKKVIIAIVGLTIIAIGILFVYSNTGLRMNIKKNNITKAAVMNGNNGVITVVEGEKL